MSAVVLDASAVLAVLNMEPGAASVTAALDDALLSIVNYTEVISKLVERGAGIDLARAAIENLALPIVDFDLEQANRTGELRAETMHLGLSLGDRACLVLAEREQAVALTSDQRWARFQSDIEVRVIR